MEDTSRIVLQLFTDRGGSRYGGEAVSQLEHALQAAFLAEQEGASAELITAALLHDVGHLLHQLPEDSPDRGIDDRHEALGSKWLSRRFGLAVSAPVDLHVAAKRYLCTVEPAYLQSLSAPSVQSFYLQGGGMSETEVQAFEKDRHSPDAVRLRRWDDQAKVKDLPTPDIHHFVWYVEAASAGRGI